MPAFSPDWPGSGQVGKRMTDISTYMNTLGAQARAASRVMAAASTASKNAALLAMIDALHSSRDVLQAANELDLQAGREKGLDAAMLDRLALTPARIDGMIEGLRQVAVLQDPVGKPPTCITDCP